jgi:hypothetical protein
VLELPLVAVVGLEDFASACVEVSQDAVEV